MTIRKQYDPHTTGVIAHFATGGYGPYHRMNCLEAPAKGDPGVRGVIHAPWKYLSAHWTPCPRCAPPVEAEAQHTAAA